MKTKLFHIGYFVALIILSFMSYFAIFGFGFVGIINIFTLVFPFILSVSWLSDYTWRLLSLKAKADKIQLFRQLKIGHLSVYLFRVFL